MIRRPLPLLFLSFLVFFARIPLSYASLDIYPAILGNGYDSLSLEPKLHKCASGEEKTIPNQEAVVQFNKVESWHRLNSEFSFQIPGSIFLKSDTELGRFVLRARDSQLTSTYILKSKVSTGKKILTNPTIDMDQQGDHFHSSCGTQFVTLIETGGELYVGIKFSFADQAHKEDFDAGGSISSITGLGHKIKTMNKEIKKKSSMEIFFHQSGGNLEDLDEMFKSKDIIACSLENFETCETLIASLWNYSTDQFVRAVKDGKQQTISFRATDYPDRPRAFEDPKVIRGRKQLLDSLDHHLMDRDLIAVMKVDGNTYEGCDARCLSTLSSQISANIRDIKESIKLSFLDPDRFIAYGLIEHMDLTPYHFPQNVVKPKSHSQIKLAGRLLAAGFAIAVAIPILYYQFNGSGSET